MFFPNIYEILDYRLCEDVCLKIEKINKDKFFIDLKNQTIKIWNMKIRRYTLWNKWWSSTYNNKYYELRKEWIEFKRNNI